MRYNSKQVLMAAKMSSTPLIVVEGRDDIQYYQKICKSIGKKVKIKPCKLIDMTLSGCEGVITFIQSIQPILDKFPELKKFVIGIIDKDSRFKNEDYKSLKSLDCLFILKYYSYESHLITSEISRQLISKLTYIDEELIDHKAIDAIEYGIEEKYNILYYLSLEALKNSINTGYVSVLGYGEEAGSVFNNIELHKKVLNKKEELDKFARIMNIDRQQIKHIAKGKWILRFYSNVIIENYVKLKHLCRKGEINQCHYCKAGHEESECLWKYKSKFKDNQLEDIIKDNCVDENEIDYIKQRLNLLA